MDDIKESGRLYENIPGQKMEKEYGDIIIDIMKNLEHTAWHMTEPGYFIVEISGITHLSEDAARKAIKDFNDSSKSTQGK
jgi:hypothetical protein